MRLRFGRPSFLILMVFAILAGIVFYWLDNRSDAPPVLPLVTDVPQIAAATAQAEIPVTPTRTSQNAAPVIGRRQQIPPGTTIFIPRASIYSTVVQAFLDGRSWDISQLRTNVGHLEGTAWVDQPGNVVLSGHVELSNGNPGIFANLTDLQVSDLIIVTTPDAEHRYRVVDIYRTVPEDLNPIRPTTSDRLTLITCGAYDFYSDIYQERIIVVAERIQ